MKRLLIGITILTLGLAACGGDNSSTVPVINDANPIQWDRSPATVVFRADVTGGSTDPFLARSEVPACTIYGDNHAVWVNELGVNNVQVLEDRLSDDQIRAFVTELAINKEFYKYTANGDTQPIGDVKPVVETLTLFVNGVNHVTDAFGGWDYDYYQRIRDDCQQVSESPVLYVPAAGWVSAREVPYDSHTPGIPWNAANNGLSLSELAASGERKWITDRNVAVIWDTLRSSPATIQFFEDNKQYQVALEVPNVTRDAPPAPA
ncbi:MAG: hypothetical protein R3E39_14905 [Anaerolineae bacterium]